MRCCFKAGSVGMTVVSSKVVLVYSVLQLWLFLELSFGRLQ